MSTYLGTHTAALPLAMPAPSRTTPRLVAPAPAPATAAEVLASMSLSWSDLVDVRWPRDVAADHVAVGPGGVFVIKVAAWDGEVRMDDDILRVGGRARARAIASAKDAASAVIHTVPLVDTEDVHAVVCLRSDQQITGDVRGVAVCTTATLQETIESFPGHFSRDQSALVALFIRNGMQPQIEPGRHAGRKVRRPRLRYNPAGLHAVR